MYLRTRYEYMLLCCTVPRLSELAYVCMAIQSSWIRAGQKTASAQLLRVPRPKYTDYRFFR